MVIEAGVTIRKKKRELALSGKLDLKPAYVVMAFNFAVSYVTLVTYGWISGTRVEVALRDFGLRDIPAVSGAVSLSRDANLCAYVATVQWVLIVLYLLVFCLFLSPFSKVVRVAVHRAMRREIEKSDEREESKRAFGRVLLIVLFVLVLMGDIGIIPFPTFLNGRLFAVHGGELFVSYLLNSPAWMPAFLWVIVLGTFLFYWSVIHLAANYKVVWDI
jgi:hypothetical protein